MSLVQRPYRHPSHLKKPITETRALKHPAAPPNSYANHQALLARADALDAAGNHAEADAHRAQAAKALRDAKIAAMEAEGRFHVLDKPLAVKDRNRIRAMDTAQVSRLINKLRDHLDVETLVVNLDPTNLEDVRRAQRIAAFLGDVSMTWVEGQTRKHDRQAAALIDSYNQGLRSALRLGKKELAAWRGHHGAKFESMARELGAARYDAVTQLLQRTVGTDKPIQKVKQHSSAPPNIQDQLSWVSPLIPNALKSGVENNCRDAYIFTAGDESHYDDADTSTVVYYTERVYEEQRKRIDAQVGSVPRKCMVHLPDVGRTVSVKLGGLEGNAEDEEHARRAIEALNTAASRTKSTMKFRRGVTPNGHLTVVPYHPITQSATVSGNALAVTGERHVLLHEFGHRIEHGNPYVTSLERYAIRSRLKPGEKAVSDKGAFKRFEDTFANYYSGTVWKDWLRKTELFTTGLETLCGYRNGAGVGLAMRSNDMDKSVNHLVDTRLIEDRELVSMTLGILITAKREK